MRARCSIHAIKPGVCREVPAAYEFGTPTAQCDKARLAHGMAVLTPEDWLKVRNVLAIKAQQDVAKSPGTVQLL